MSGYVRTCADYKYFDEDESWSEDDYFYFNFCDIGAKDSEEVTPETEACAAFTPIIEARE